MRIRIGREPQLDKLGAVVSALTFDRAFVRWCFTVECDRPRRWAAAFSDPATRTAATTPTSRSVVLPAAPRDDRRVMTLTRAGSNRARLSA